MHKFKNDTLVNNNISGSPSDGKPLVETTDNAKVDINANITAVGRHGPVTALHITGNSSVTLTGDITAVCMPDPASLEAVAADSADLNEKTTVYTSEEQESDSESDVFATNKNCAIGVCVDGNSTFNANDANVTVCNSSGGSAIGLLISGPGPVVNMSGCRLKVRNLDNSVLDSPPDSPISRKLQDLKEPAVKTRTDLKAQTELKEPKDQTEQKSAYEQVFLDQLNDLTAKNAAVFQVSNGARINIDNCRASLKTAEVSTERTLKNMSVTSRSTNQANNKTKSKLSLGTVLLIAFILSLFLNWLKKYINISFAIGQYNIKVV